jgi:hypothetical protein
MAPTRKTQFLLMLILMLGAFLGGLIPMYLKYSEASSQMQTAQRQTAELRAQLRIASLRNDLGTMLVEVEQTISVRPKNFRPISSTSCAPRPQPQVMENCASS